MIGTIPAQNLSPQQQIIDDQPVNLAGSRQAQEDD